jgi:D-alanyl-D-alanine dipeptidase
MKRDSASQGILVTIFTICLALAGSHLSGAAWAAEPMPAGFRDVSAVIPDIVLDMRYGTAHNFVGETIDGYRAPKCILTKEAAAALAKVQGELRGFSLSLKIYDCYRPQRAVDHFVRWAGNESDTRMKKEFYPAIDKANLFKDGYIASKSGHTRGSTVDLTIVPLPVSKQEEYAPGQKLRACTMPAAARFRDNSVDMGCGFDCFDERAHTAFGGIGLAQRMNRLLLKALMEKHGFYNYEVEWWHFTLKGEPFSDTYFDFPIE